MAGSDGAGGRGAVDGCATGFRKPVAAGQYSITDLRTMTGGYYYSTAYDINNRGQVVGYSGTASGDEYAFLWSKRGP
jgi:probable HAF family extracellular repeat protein